MRLKSAAATLYVASLIPFGCSREMPDPLVQGSASVHLKPLTTPLVEPVIRRTVYVPVYSSIYWGIDIKPNMVALAATVSIRNVSSRYPLVLESVRYYDSAGKQVREYLSTASELGTLATVEFVIQRRDTIGGPGANFLVRWAGPSGMDEPLIEAIMVGQTGNAGISFTSAGRVVKEEEAP